MTEDLCELRIIGKITSDVEVKKSASGTSWLSFTIESNIGKYKSFNKLMAFKEVADNLAANTRKGKRIKLLASCRQTKNNKTNSWETQLCVYKFNVLEEEENKPIEQPTINPQNEVPSTDKDDLPF